MTDSSRAGLAGAAGSCPRPSRQSPARCWEWPWSGGCLCPGWAPDRFVAQEGLPTLHPGAHSSSPPSQHPEGGEALECGSGTAATPGRSARVAVPGRGPRAEQPRSRCCCSVGPECHPPLPHLHPYLASISARAPCPACPGAAHRPLRARGSGSRRLAVPGVFANMLLSPLVPQNQGR